MGATCRGRPRWRPRRRPGEVVGSNRARSNLARLESGGAQRREGAQRVSRVDESAEVGAPEHRGADRLAEQARYSGRSTSKHKAAGAQSTSAPHRYAAHQTTPLAVPCSMIRTEYSLGKRPRDHCHWARNQPVKPAAKPANAPALLVRQQIL